MRNITAKRSTTFTALTAAAVAAALLAAAPVAAQSLSERAGDSGVRVGYSNYKPYAYVDESGDLTGEQVDILRHILGQMGYAVESEQATEWGNLIPGITAGRFDIVAAGMFVNEKRCRAVRFSDPTFGIQQGMVVLKGNPNGIVNYDSVREKGLKIAATTGSAQVGHAKKSGIDPANILELPDNPTAVAALRAGRAHVLAISAPVARSIVASLPEQDMETVPPFATVAGEKTIAHGAYAFRQADGDFVDEFDGYLNAFIGTAEHIAIMQKHGMSADELPQLKTAEICSE